MFSPSQSELDYVQIRPKLRVLLLDHAYFMVQYHKKRDRVDYLNLPQHFEDLAGIVDDMNQSLHEITFNYDVKEFKVLLLLASKGCLAELRQKLWSHTEEDKND